MGTSGMCINFDIVYPDAAAGDFASKVDPSPYVHLADPTHDLACMQSPNDVVIEDDFITVDFEYPFTGGFPWTLRSTGGFTRRGLAKAIFERYQCMYTEEDQTSDEIAGYIPGMLNRTTTDGRFGIWGHDLEDLVLHEVSYDGNTGHWKLRVDS